MSGKGDKYKSYGPGTTSAPGVKAETQGRIESTKEATGTRKVPNVRMTSDRLAKIEADRLLGANWEYYYGRASDGTSLRLSPRDYIAFAPVDKSDIGDFDIDKLGSVLGIPAKGGKRQRGGNFEESVEGAKVIAMILAYKTQRAGEYSIDYVKAEIINPIFGTSGRVVEILINLAEQLVVQTPVTVINGILASVGFTANVLTRITAKFNAWGRAGAASLLSDELAEQAAAIAVADAKTIATTAGVGAIVANQVGILPMSALVAAILRGLKIATGNRVARANVVAMLYAWYLAQDEQTRNTIKQNVVEFANNAKDLTATGVAKTKQIAVTLAPYLLATGVAAAGVAVAVPGAVAAVPGAVAAAVSAVPPMFAALQVQIQGMNAFQAVVAALGAAGVAQGVVVPQAQDAAINVLEVGVPGAAQAVTGAYGADLEAAANAAMQAEDAVAAADAMQDVPAAAPGAPAGGRKHRKTKKRAMRKRRITRRRPLFSY